MEPSRAFEPYNSFRCIGNGPWQNSAHRKLSASYRYRYLSNSGRTLGCRQFPASWTGSAQLASVCLSSSNSKVAENDKALASKQKLAALGLQEAAAICLANGPSILTVMMQQQQASEATTKRGSGKFKLRRRSLCHKLYCLHVTS